MRQCTFKDDSKKGITWEDCNFQCAMIRRVRKSHVDPGRPEGHFNLRLKCVTSN